VTEKGLAKGALGWIAVSARDQEIMTELHTRMEKFDRALLFGCLQVRSIDILTLGTWPQNLGGLPSAFL
jgi:hypothetical protein